MTTQPLSLTTRTNVDIEPLFTMATTYLGRLDASQDSSIHTYTPIRRSPLSIYVTDDSWRRTITFRPDNHTKKQGLSINLLERFGRTLRFQEGRVVGWEELDWDLDGCSEWFRDVVDVVMGDDNGGGEEEGCSYLNGIYGSSPVEQDFDPWIVNPCENRCNSSGLSIPQTQYGDGDKEKETSNVSNSSLDTATAIASMLCDIGIIPGFITQQALQGNNFPVLTPFIDPEAAASAQVLCSWYSSSSIGGPIWSDFDSSTSSENTNNNWQLLLSNALCLPEDSLAPSAFFSGTEATEDASRLLEAHAQERSMDNDENVNLKKHDEDSESDISIVVFEGNSQKRKREDQAEHEGEESSGDCQWVGAGGCGGAKRRRLG